MILAQVADDVRSPSRARAAEMLNREAGRAATQLALRIGHDGSSTWQLHHLGRDEDIFVTDVVSRCILFLGGPDAARVLAAADPRMSGRRQLPRIVD